MKRYGFVSGVNPDMHAVIHRREIRLMNDVLKWVHDSHQVLDRDNRVTATFIVDTDHVLYIMDQRYEHVVCAAGGEVLCAGEMVFQITQNTATLAEVTNQSTGYCPEPGSWPAVAGVLNHAGIQHPGGFTFPCIFRRCPACEQINLVKENTFECGVCGAELPAEWNFS